MDDSRKSTVAATGNVESQREESGVEQVTIRNKGQYGSRYRRWTLRDRRSVAEYTFPAGTQIAAGGTVEVYTEPGHPYSFNSRSSIWNNCGDALEL